MKITKIEIKDHHQFKDFELELIYPKGHQKEGQPLDKVCFIGQSGTGKTTILNLIDNALTFNYVKYSAYRFDSREEHCKVILCGITEGKIFELYNFGSESRINLIKTNEDEDTNFLKQLIIYPSELIEKANSLFTKQLIEDPLRYISTDEDIRKQAKKEDVELKNKRVFDFGKDDPREIWKIILSEASEYMVKSLKNSQTFERAVINDPQNAVKLAENMAVWHKLNPSPFLEIANELNPTLKYFNLRVQATFNFEKREDLDFIKIESLQGENVPFRGLSTGTKQFLLTSVPLFKLDTNDAIVLFDEPERSLYPDVERSLINYYTSLAPDAQFFYATHSPLIASQFEPCERFILNYNENGNVIARQGNTAQGNTPNYLLLDDFALETVLTEKGEEMWDKFLNLKKQIRSESDEIIKNKLMTEFMEIGVKYKFGNYEKNN